MGAHRSTDIGLGNMGIGMGLSFDEGEQK